MWRAEAIITTHLSCGLLFGGNWIDKMNSLTFSTSTLLQVVAD